MPDRPVALSSREARRVALHAQLLSGPRPAPSPGGMARTLGTLRAVQLDTISVLARSHELVAYARLGPVARATIEDAYWGAASQTFEYWSHAACILPLEDWPLYGFKRRARRERGFRWHQIDDIERHCSYVRDRITLDGPLTARELGGAKRGGPWWDWSETKIAAEWLLDVGEMVCRKRVGFQRVYDLAERAIPAELFELEPDDAECRLRLVESAARALGVATAGDIAAYHGLGVSGVERALSSTSLVAVTVEGWERPAFADPCALELADRPVRRRPTLVSPFDSLLWDRARTERLFAIAYRLEAYVPRPLRVHGYFAMPVLAGDRLVALVDPGRSGKALVAKTVTFKAGDRRALEAVASALADAARWVGCDQVTVGQVTPAKWHAALTERVAALSLETGRRKASSLRQGGSPAPGSR